MSEHSSSSGNVVVDVGLAIFGHSKGRKASRERELAIQRELERIEFARTQPFRDVQTSVTDARFAGTGRSRGRNPRGGFRAVDSVADIEAAGGGQQFDPEFADDPFPIIADQELSPVFAIGAAGTVRSSVENAILKSIFTINKAQKEAARLKGLKAQSKQAREILNSRTKIPQLGSSTIKELIKIAQRQFPDAAKLIKKGAKIAGKIKPASIGRVGGLAGTAIGVGGQFAIEKISKIAEERQFAQMEQILKKQQRETDAIVAKVRARKAADKVQTKVEAPPKVPAKGAPAPKPQAAPKRPQAVKAPVITAAKVELSRPRIAKSSQILKQPKSAGVQSQAQKRVELIGRVLGFGLKTGISALLVPKQPRGSTTTLLVPQTQTQTQRSGGTGRSGGSAVITGQCCPCPKPRKKSDKKRKAPRVCVTKSAAKKGGFLDEILAIRKRKK